MSRTYVVTGSASGIGQATAELLSERNHRVIGVDVRGAEIIADLSTAEGRVSMAAQVGDLSGGRIDAIVANAGLVSPTVATLAVNYFGAVATLTLLRPFLEGSQAPRAVATASGAAFLPPDSELLGCLDDDDEQGALRRAEALADEIRDQTNPIYRTSKRGLVRWMRRQAPTPDWAGAGIALNMIAPGVVDTPMIRDNLATTAARESLLAVAPSPLNGIAEPREVAYLLAWLTSEENTHLCGQTIFIDGGSEVTMRGTDGW
jgi:NAD(P)-dependent dehydrogenase (short-subunit alcohol dehydrogenase family)